MATQTGIITTDFGFSELAYSMTIQADGKILLAGYSNNGGNDDFALARYNSNGSLDSSFDGDGKVITPMGLSNDVGRSVTVQADGKILVAGNSKNGSDYNFALVRYNPDGSLDSTFGSNGKITTSAGSGYDGGGDKSVTVQADGKILVAGTSSNDFALVRYNSDGSLDTSFDGDGKVTTSISSSWDSLDYGFSLAVQADGKILVAGAARPNGFALVRYNSDGSLDTSFDSDGKVTTPVGSHSGYSKSVSIQADGKILLAGDSNDGSNNTDFALVRYNPNGSLDTSFDGDGKVTTAVGSNYDYGESFSVQADGKILVAGRSENGNKVFGFALVRYNSDGSLDTSFDGDGKVTTAGGVGQSVSVQADGKILVAGTGNAFDFALVRYNSNGSLDTTFGDAPITPNPAILNITPTDADKKEGGGAFTFTVNRTGDSSTVSTVDYAISGGTATTDDFTPSIVRTVSFAIGETSQIISIPVANDTIVEPDETFNVVLSNPTGATLGTATAMGTIRNDDAKTNPILNIVATDADKKEGGGAFTFTVNRTGDSSIVSTVDYAISGGTATADDFTPSIVRTVSFAIGETSQIISIPVANDTLVEPDETFNVVLSNPTGATLGTASAMGTIRNDDINSPTIPTLKVTGTSGDDILIGTTANEHISGLAGSDILSGSAGDDVLDGGDGIDKAIYTGNLANFTITKTATGFTVKDNTGANGTDTVTNIEQLKFDDASINLSVQTKAVTTNIPAATLKVIQELYVGFFKRIPDANGLEYWIEQHKAGKTVNQIADAFYDAGVQYSSSTGYSATMTSAEFIKIVYANVLGRTGSTAPNTTEIDFWNQKLIAGAETRGSVVTTMLDTVHTQYANDPVWGWVGKLLDNKAAVASKVAVEWGITYNDPSISITKGMEIASAVTVDSVTEAINLVGVNSVFV